MFKVQTANIFKFITTILVLSVSTPRLYAESVESAAPSLEYEEALAKSEAARQESSDSQKDIEQERLNSEPVIANAKMAIDKAALDEKIALKDKLNAEKIVNSLRQQKSQLLKTQAKKETAVKSAQKVLAKIEKQKNSLEADNRRLNESNTKMSEQIKEQMIKAKTLQAEIKTLKAKHDREVKLKKSLRLKLAKSKANVKSLQVSRGKIR